MELLRLGAPGHEIPVARAGDMTYDLRPITADVTPAFLADGLRRAATAVGSGDLPEIDPRGLRIGAPISRPGAIVCIGQNYAAHAAESGAAPPNEPIVFFKHPGSLAGPDDDVVLPPGSTQSDWEAELVVVIGRSAHQLTSLDEAEAVIAGLTVGNDVSERSWQLGKDGGQWSQGKSFPTFGPVGPAIVVGELGDQPRAIRSWVNGDPRQDSSTKDMIFGVDHLVWYLSQTMALEPGDLVFTGTPEGVALSGRFDYLADGDIVEVEIEGLGRQRQRVVKP